MASPNKQNKRLSPRKGLQGTRPPLLKVGRNSGKTKKQPLEAPGHAQQPGPCRPPVIIYMKSPEVIHVDPQNFMNTVQHLTGNSSSSRSTSSSEPLPLPLPSSGDGVDCTTATGTSTEEKGREPAADSNIAEIDHMLFMQNMSSWGPPSVPWYPPISYPTSSNCISPNDYPDFCDFDMIPDTPHYQHPNNESSP